MTINGIIVIVFAVFLTSIANAQSKAKQEKPSNWQKMKECSEQTDKVAKRYGWREMKTDGDTAASIISTTMLSWRNHYSPKYDRCYIQVFYTTSMSAKQRAEMQIPLYYSELYDAFEYDLLATATEYSPFEKSEHPGKCFIDNKGRPCQQCRDFIQERMNK